MRTITSHPRFIKLKHFLGITGNSTSHSEKIISAVGGFVAFLIMFIIIDFNSKFFQLSSEHTMLIVASMGASAVLLYAVPNGALSQPWPVFGGHVISAIIGVSVTQLVPWQILAAPLAVGLAIGAMYYFRCIHPPGGATALSAVIGGQAVIEQGFNFVLVPVLLNVVIMLSLAILINNIFRGSIKRRYPAYLTHLQQSKTAPSAIDRQFELTQEDFAAAINQLDSFVDITTDGLIDLLELAKIHAEKNTIHPEEIIAGKIYSNGKIGNLWSIRQVVDASDHPNPDKDRVIFKTLAGMGGYATGICLREEFKVWARYEVVKQNDKWIKVELDD